MPSRFAPALFGFVLSGMMSLVVPGIATLRNAGLVEGVLSPWFGAWLLSWLIGFPVVFAAPPLTRRVAGLLVEAPVAGVE